MYESCHSYIQLINHSYMQLIYVCLQTTMLVRSLSAGAAACVAGATVGYVSADTSPSSDEPRIYTPKFSQVNPPEENKMRVGPARHATEQQKKKRAERLSAENSLGSTSSVANVLADLDRDSSSSPFMDVAVEEAAEGVVKGEGGPFGACIVGPDGKIIARAHNMVLQHNDPTAHAEVTCIRKACARLGRFDLSDCVIYSSCEPCPMCYGAIHWAKLPECKYAATAADAAEAGFDDQFIYDAIRNISKEQHCHFSHEPHKGACSVFKAEYSLY